MGCCQNRDDGKVFFNRPALDRSKTMSVDLGINSGDQENVIPTNAIISGVYNNQEIDERNLLMLAKGCNEKRKWDQLSPLLTNSTEVKHPNIAISWTEKPKTISCIAMVYLALAVKKYTTVVAPYIEVFIPVIVAHIRTGGTEMKENGIYLLHCYIDFASEKAIGKLISLKLFNYIVRYILAPKIEFRKYTVNLCYKMYKERPNIKLSFIQSDGAFNLIQLIGWNSNSDFLEELLKCLEEVIVEHEEFNKENIKLTKEPLTLDILKGIDVSTKSLELRSKIEIIIKAYE